MDNPEELVNTFNSLSRTEKVPSGLVANTWHISLRHVPLNPPGDVLFIVNPPSRYIHTTPPLPPKLSHESLPVQASVWSLIIIKAFNDGLGGPQQFARRPWKWDIKDAEMAGAVGEAMRTLGVREPADVGLAQNEEENKASDEMWDDFKGRLTLLQGGAGLTGA